MGSVTGSSGLPQRREEPARLVWRRPCRRWSRSIVSLLNDVTVFSVVTVGSVDAPQVAVMRFARRLGSAFDCLITFLSASSLILNPALQFAHPPCMLSVSVAKQSCGVISLWLPAAGFADCASTPQNPLARQTARSRLARDGLSLACWHFRSPGYPNRINVPGQSLRVSPPIFRSARSIL
jgi:hypothetical protein